MPRHQISVKGYEPFEVEEGAKLAYALEQNGVDLSHRCGGNARCTTCRVKFASPEPEMKAKEHDCLEEDGVLGEFRLSCQIAVDRPMTIEVLKPVATADWDDPGVDLEPGFPD
jgi:ferredoxin